MEIVEPYDPVEFKAYFKARWNFLRKPWGFERGSEVDDYENLSLHVMAKENNEIVGVGRLTYFTNGEGQVRFMGVDENFRNQNIGTEILVYLENEARKMGLKRLFLNAREEALKFYKMNGYKTQGNGFEGFAKITHTKMTKKL